MAKEIRKLIRKGARNRTLNLETSLVTSEEADGQLFFALSYKQLLASLKLKYSTVAIKTPIRPTKMLSHKLLMAP